MTYAGPYGGVHSKSRQLAITLSGCRVMMPTFDGAQCRTIHSTQKAAVTVFTITCSASSTATRGCAAPSATRRRGERFPVRRASYQTYQVPEFAEATRIVSPRFIRHAHSAGLKIQVWTVDEEQDMRRLLDWGVDALISNRPDVAVRIRDEFLARS